MKIMFQFIHGKRIAATSDNSQCGRLFDWVEKVAGTEAAIDAQGWSELCEIGEIYEGENFEIVCYEG